MAQPAAAIDPVPVGREADLSSRPADVRVLRFADEGETGAPQPTVDRALQAAGVSCGIGVDGKFLDRSGPLRVASCRWDG